MKMVLAFLVFMFSFLFILNASAESDLLSVRINLDDTWKKIATNDGTEVFYKGDLSRFFIRVINGGRYTVMKWAADEVEGLSSRGFLILQRPEMVMYGSRQWYQIRMLDKIPVKGTNIIFVQSYTQYGPFILEADLACPENEVKANLEVVEKGLANISLGAASLINNNSCQPCKKSDLIGNWKMVDIQSVVPIREDDLWFSPYQLFAFYEDGTTKQLTTNKPITEEQYVILSSSPTTSNYDLNEEGMLQIKKKAVYDPEVYKCDYYLESIKDKDEREIIRKGDVALSFTRPLIIKILRKTD